METVPWSSDCWNKEGSRKQHLKPLQFLHLSCGKALNLTLLLNALFSALFWLFKEMLILLCLPLAYWHETDKWKQSRVSSLCWPAEIYGTMATPQSSWLFCFCTYTWLCTQVHCCMCQDKASQALGRIITLSCDMIPKYLADYVQKVTCSLRGWSQYGECLSP